LVIPLLPIAPKPVGQYSVNNKNKDS